MSEFEHESIENLYSKLCLDLNMDIETKEDAWRSYEHIRKHYVLEGDQLHWLAVSLYVSCRRNRFLTSIDNNPISISRLLKSANHLELIVFFDKLHKWEDMANLPDSIRFKIDQVEHAFNISSIIFEKRTSNQINPKLNQKNKANKLNHHDLYSLIWTIYALAKTIYPSTINDLIASFHLLISSFIFIYDYSKLNKLDYLIKGSCLKELCSSDGTIIDKLCEKYSCSSEMCRTIIEEHLKSDLIKCINKSENFLNENNYLETIRDINRQYDEIVLTNCIIDERIFLENQNQLNDLLSNLNENRYSKSYQNRTPITASQHLASNDYQTNNSNQFLTPISQANQLIKVLFEIIKDQQSTKPSNNLRFIIGQQTFLDDLIERLNEWENIFNKSYDSIEEINNFNKQLNPSRSCQSRFDLSLKLIYNSLENILTIEKKRLESIQFNSQQQIQQSFQKLILNNQFLKSLLGLCILLVLYSHNDKYHDFNWLLNIYSLHGYSFLKIIQIFLKTSQQISKCRQFIKYLSSIEEIIISSMDSLSPNNHLTPIFIQSPNKNNVSRKLLQSSTATTITPNQFNNNLSLIRSQSDGIVEKTVKLCPYSMFYRRLYDLVSSRLDILCLRLFSSQSNQIEKLIWNFFIYLFENYLELLFRSRDLDQILLSSIYFISNSKLIQNNQELTWTRLIQSYKSMPNAKLKTLRSVFIRSINQQNDFIFHQDSYRENPCLTPSKPAGTIHIIDGNMFGDITSFYKEIFLKIDNLEKSFENYLKTIELIEISNRMKPNENQKTTNNISINIGQNIFIDYSSNKIQSNLFSSNNLKANSYQTNSQNKSTSNVLSSSIQAGANNTVRTTRIQTEDGKFLTTISTISKLTNNNSDDIQENIFIEKTQTNLLFGQSNNNSIKRTLSQDSNSNCLTSLTKKVLQIEKDRQKLEQN
ncbi:unnamed protein product [Rotaria magnacalcarata]